VKIVEHFCCYTNLPIKLSDVRAHVIETSPVDRLYRVPVDINTDILKGAYRQYHHKPPYCAPGGEVVGEVLYSQHLGPYEARLVQCKEMLHAFDTADEAASDIELVAQLAKDIILPLDILLKDNGVPSKQAQSDRAKLLPAIAILLPRDFLDEIRPLYEADRVSVSDIAKFAKVPSAYVRVALRPEWKIILEQI
jgi:hypothetical protein